MTTATRLVYDAAGQPEIDGAVEALGNPCWLCGAQVGALAVPYDVFVKPTFNDHDKARAPESPYVCCACVFCAAESSALLAGRVGKDKPQRMRNYSHFVVDGAWHPLSKGQKPQMLELLPRAQLAVIADSGQKHLIFKARPGAWQFEEQQVTPDVDGLHMLLVAMQSLYAFCNKSMIERGDYGAWHIQQVGLPEFKAREAVLKPWRDSALFGLALFLLQKGDERDDSGTGGDDHLHDSQEHELGRVGQEAPEVLGRSDGQHSQCGIHQQAEQVCQRALL